MVRKLSLRGLFQTVCLLMQFFFIYFESNQKGKKLISCLCFMFWSRDYKPHKQLRYSSSVTLELYLNFPKLLIKTCFDHCLTFRSSKVFPSETQICFWFPLASVWSLSRLTLGEPPSRQLFGSRQCRCSNHSNLILLSAFSLLMPACDYMNVSSLSYI